MRSMAAATLSCLAVAATFLAGCATTGTPTTANPTTGTAPPPASARPATSPTPAVKEITAGNCTVYPKAMAVTLLGGVNLANNAIAIGTDGGTKIDVCSYLDLKSLQDLQGVSYAVVRYDSAATAFTEAKKVQVEMLGSAAQNNWSVQSLTTPAPGAGQVLGGYGTKSDNGLTYTMAVVGTNVGPYLVAALGASTESPANAKKYALAVFQALSAAVG